MCEWGKWLGLPGQDLERFGDWMRQAKEAEGLWRLVGPPRGEGHDDQVIEATWRIILGWRSREQEKVREVFSRPKKERRERPCAFCGRPTRRRFGPDPVCGECPESRRAS